MESEKSFYVVNDVATHQRSKNPLYISKIFYAHQTQKVLRFLIPWASSHSLRLPVWTTNSILNTSNRVLSLVNLGEFTRFIDIRLIVCLGLTVKRKFLHIRSTVNRHISGPQPWRTNFRERPGGKAVAEHHKSVQCQLASAIVPIRLQGNMRNAI